MTAPADTLLINIPLNVPAHRPLVLSVKPYADWGVSKPIAANRIWESYNTALVQAVVREGDTFLDIGAHLGYFTTIAADRVGPTGRVFCFEPEPENAAILQVNVQQNGFADRVVIFPCAVGDEEKTERLYRAQTNHGAHQLAHVYRDGADTEGIPVRTIALDELMKREPGLQKVDFIKMDVQGYETKALFGMQHLIEKNRDHLVMLLEFSPSLLMRFDAQQAGLAQFLHFLETRAAAIFFVKRQGTGQRAVPLARIRPDQLQQVSNLLLEESDRDEEDRCADLLCVFSDAACSNMLAKAMSI